MPAPALVIEKRLRAPLHGRPGADEVSGFVVVAQPFASGDLLCLRRFPSSTFGPGYTSLWHRSAAGSWTVYTSVAPEVSCPRFIGAAVSRIVSNTPIHVDWTGPSELTVEVPDADLRWELTVVGTPVTRTMNVMMSLMPAVLFRTLAAQWMMSLMSTAMLAAGRLRLFGHVPNHQWYVSSPRRIWRIANAKAMIDQRDLGRPMPLAHQASLGQIPMAQCGILIVGVFSFETYDPTRHLAPAAGLP